MSRVDEASGRSPLARLLREPLVWFAAIALGVFAVDAARQAPWSEPQAVIALSPAELARIEAAWAAQNGRAPTPEQRQGLIDQWTEEEILYREALAMGLEEGDTIVRRRLVQKMTFLLDSLGAPAEPPTDAQLRRLLAERPDAFVLPPKFSFDQLPLGTDDPSAAQRALDALRAGADPASLGEPSLLPRHFEAAVPVRIAFDFGQDFADTLAALKSGEWNGPIGSSVGQHLVRVVAAEPARGATFEEARPGLQLLWSQEAEARRRNEAFAKLQAKYAVQPAPPGAPAP